jgi:hypothetical protein
VAVLLLAAVVAAAQSPKEKSKPVQMTETEKEAGSTHALEGAVVSARETGSGMATGRRSGSVVALDRASVTTARETSTGMATGKRVSGDPHEYVERRNSAHASVSLDGDSKDPVNPSEVQSTPLYKDGSTKGSNPLYEGKDRTAAPPSNNGSKPAEYKDGEEGNAHTRPGNHKPAK